MPLWVIIKKSTAAGRQKCIFPGVAQLVARLLWEQDAGGSSPSTRTSCIEKTAFSGGFFCYFSLYLNTDLVST